MKSLVFNLKRPLFKCARCGGELLAGGASSHSMAVRPASALERYFSCSSPPPPPLPRCCCCQPSRCTALHRAVTKLDDALPHGLQHPPRVQVQHARLLSVEPAEPLGLKVPTAASRSPTHAALARSPEPAPAGGRARCWPRPPTAGQLSGRARRAERLPAAQRRPKKKMGLVGHRENQIRHGGRHQSVLRGKPFL